MWGMWGPMWGICGEYGALWGKDVGKDVGNMGPYGALWDPVGPCGAKEARPQARDEP